MEFVLLYKITMHASTWWASQCLSVKQAVDSDGGRLHLISLFREGSEALSGTAGGRPLHEATAF